MEGWIKKGWIHDSWIHGILETSIPGVLDSWKPGWEFTGWEDDYSTSHTLDAWRGRRMTGSAGSAVDVIVYAIAFFNRRRVGEEDRRRFCWIGGSADSFFCFFQGFISNSIFGCFFERFWVPSGTSFSIKKLEKQRFGTTCGGHEKRVRKRCDF